MQSIVKIKTTNEVLERLLSSGALTSGDYELLEIRPEIDIQDEEYKILKSNSYSAYSKVIKYEQDYIDKNKLR